MTIDSNVLRLTEGMTPEAIDHVEWAAAMTLRAYGVTIGIRANDPTFLEQALELLPYGWKPLRVGAVEHLYSIVTDDHGSETPDGPIHSLYHNETVLAASTYRINVRDELERNLRLIVVEHARRRTFVHAGVVGWRGQAILIPGRSFAGKTTLVAELVRAGATYYSDDFAVLDARGRVHPFATPLQIRSEWGGPQERHDVETLGGRAGKKPLPVGFIVFTRYEEGARWRPRQLSPGRALLELLNHTAALGTRAHETLATLEQAVSHATIIKGVRADASGLARTLLEQLESERDSDRA
jgi:hypothetical protein